MQFKTFFVQTFNVLTRLKELFNVKRDLSLKKGFGNLPTLPRFYNSIFFYFSETRLGTFSGVTFLFRFQFFKRATTANSYENPVIWHSSGWSLSKKNRQSVSGTHARWFPYHTSRLLHSLIIYFIAVFINFVVNATEICEILFWYCLNIPTSSHYDFCLTVASDEMKKNIFKITIN